MKKHTNTPIKKPIMINTEKSIKPPRTKHPSPLQLVKKNSCCATNKIGRLSVLIVSSIPNMVVIESKRKSRKEIATPIVPPFM